MMRLNKILLIISALIISIIFTELVTSHVIKYPYFVEGNRKFLIHTQLGPYNIIAWRPPYYKYWSVEGGNHVFQLNNLGLPGSDVKLPLTTNNVFVLGSSFIEATTIKNTMTATSEFQQMLNQKVHKYDVINLGSSGNDPYVMYFHSLFFESKIKPEYVIVVIDPSSLIYFNDRWSDTLTFVTINDLPQELPKNRLVEYSSTPRRYSSFLNLITGGMAAVRSRNRLDNQEKQSNRSESKTVWAKFDQCIAAFKGHYEDKLIVLSIIPDVETNKKLSILCNENNCYFECNELILQPSNKINGAGHLNEKGNKLLGQFIYHAFLRFHNK